MIIIKLRMRYELLCRWCDARSTDFKRTCKQSVFQIPYSNVQELSCRVERSKWITWDHSSPLLSKSILPICKISARALYKCIFWSSVRPILDNPVSRTLNLWEYSSCFNVLDKYWNSNYYYIEANQ